MERQPHPWVIIGLILLGVVSRLVPHPWNATPVMAIALFGGAHLSRRWGILLPLLIVAASDLLIGWHATIPFTWGAFALTGLVGWWIGRGPSVTRILAGAVGGSMLFFLISNFGVWVEGLLYPRTLSGLRECYVAAIPFFRGTFLGDLVFTTVFFTSYALVTGPRVAHAPARSR